MISSLMRMAADRSIRRACCRLGAATTLVSPPILVAVPPIVSIAPPYCLAKLQQVRPTRIPLVNDFEAVHNSRKSLGGSVFDVFDVGRRFGSSERHKVHQITARRTGAALARGHYRRHRSRRPLTFCNSSQADKLDTCIERLAFAGHLRCWRSCVCCTVLFVRRHLAARHLSGVHHKVVLRCN
jgi:hypothetical protein